MSEQDDYIVTIKLRASTPAYDYSIGNGVAQHRIPRLTVSEPLQMQTPSTAPNDGYVGGLQVIQALERYLQEYRHSHELDAMVEAGVRE